MENREEIGQGAVVHELKSDQKPFLEIMHAGKCAEIRANDRLFETCDYILLRQTTYTALDMLNGKPLIYTGRHLMLKITHIQSGYGLKAGYVALSFEVFD